MSERVFTSVMAVTDYLKAEGWKVSKATLFRAVKAGKIRRADDGSFAMKAILRFASSFLVRDATRLKVADEELQRRRLVAEITWKEEQGQRERLKRMVEEGRFIPREQFELELAARASVIDTMRRNSIQTHAAERVAICGGDPARIPDLIQFDMGQHHDEMNQFASTKEFHVLFEATSKEGVN